jgi:arylsulfatase A-like enzyme/Flp pilus assembly protein TadD
MIRGRTTGGIGNMASSNRARTILRAGLGLLLLSLPAGAAAGKGPGPNLLLITIDTLRADHLSCYREGHARTPVIDGLARRGVRFDRAFAHTSTTLPSHTNIMVGATPSFHGVHENSGFMVDSELLTLAEFLKSHGYQTGAVIGAYPLDARFGLNQGFDVYDGTFERTAEQKLTSLERRAGTVVEKALAWLKDRNAPWFLWVHCYDPHDPYIPPEPYAGRYSHPYDGEVAYVDHALAGLFGYLDEAGLEKTTWVFLTGDHGESLGEHGEKTHGYFAYNSTIWIPLIIAGPGVRPGVCPTFVGHIDLFPTICDVLDLKPPRHLQGVSLTPALKGKKPPRRVIYFESLYPYFTIGWAPIRGIISGGEKFIETPIPELYDLERDFDERSNLAGSRELADHRRQLLRVIEEQASPAHDRAEKRFDRKTIENLQSLGYLSAGGRSPRKTFSPEDDVKVLLPLTNRADNALRLFEAGETRRALEELKAVITERNDIDVAYRNLAGLYRRTGRPRDALEVLRLGLDNIPESYPLFSEYLNGLLDGGRFADVIEEISGNKYPEMDHDPEIWNVYGIALFQTGRLEEAVDIYRQALPMDPRSPILLANLGEAQLALAGRSGDRGLLAESLKNLEEAVRIDPKYPSAHRAMGLARRMAGNPEQAIASFTRALELNPNLDDALFYLGITCLEQGDRDRALEVFTLYKRKYGAGLPAAAQEKLEELLRRSRKNPDSP